MTEVKIQWLLFVIFSASIPLYFIAPMAGTYSVPLAIVAYYTTQWGVNLSNYNPFTIMILGEFLIYLTIVYFFSKHCSMWIYKLQKKSRYCSFFIGSLVTFAVTFSPIYGFETGDNLYETYSKLVRFK